MLSCSNNSLEMLAQADAVFDLKKAKHAVSFKINI